jgi:excisionase family DNA binding protein
MTEPTSAARFITTTRAAELLGISLRKVYELLDAGELDSIKLPGARQAGRRIEVASMDAFIERSRVVPAATARATTP